MINHVGQPADSRICGQCVLAMITGEPLEKVLEVLGINGTSSNVLIWYLYTKGTKCSYRFKRTNKHFRPGADQKYIGRVRWYVDGKAQPGGHWVLISGYGVYDPSLPVGPVTFNYWQKHLARHNGKLTSILQIL